MDPIGANPNQPKPANLLTAKQVAELLQWNPYTIVKKAEKGDLPGFKLGREWRFRQAIRAGRRQLGQRGRDNMTRFGRAPDAPSARYRT